LVVVPSRNARGSIVVAVLLLIGFPQTSHEWRHHLRAPEELTALLLDLLGASSER
jgi:hypothetical protein